MYQLVSKVLTFTKIPNYKPKYSNKYLLEMLNTQIIICNTQMNEKRSGLFKKLIKVL